MLLSGKFVTTKGSRHVTGARTAFGEEIDPGQVITIGGREVMVDDVHCATHLTLTEPFAGPGGEHQAESPGDPLDPAVIERLSSDLES
jgi:hypothetical protein